MVGVSDHDVEVGVAAAMFAVWVSHGQERTFAAEPCLTVRDLPELHEVLRRAVT